MNAGATRLRPVLGAVAVTLLAASLTVPEAAGASSTLPVGNLLVNPGAEDDPGGSEVSKVYPSNWSGDAHVIAYGSSATHGGYPSETVGASMGGGENFFAPNNQKAERYSYLSQWAYIGDSDAVIDAGRAVVEASAMLGGYGSTPGRAEVYISFFDENLDPLSGHLHLPPVTAADRNFETGYLERSDSEAVPPSTRSILVSVQFNTTSNIYNSGFADNLEVSLSETAEPPSGRLVVRATGSAGLGDVLADGITCIDDGTFTAPTQVVEGCYKDYAHGTQLTLQARPHAGSRFSHWINDGDGHPCHFETSCSFKVHEGVTEYIAGDFYLKPKRIASEVDRVLENEVLKSIRLALSGFTAEPESSLPERLQVEEGAATGVLMTELSDAEHKLISDNGSTVVNFVMRDGTPKLIPAIPDVIGNRGQSLIGNNGNTLVGLDGAGLVGLDAASLVGADGAGRAVAGRARDTTKLYAVAYWEQEASFGTAFVPELRLTATGEAILAAMRRMNGQLVKKGLKKRSLPASYVDVTEPADDHGAGGAVRHVYIK